MKWLTITVGLSLLLVGCAAQTRQMGLATSGQALIQVGTQFVAVGAIYRANCLPTAAAANLVKFCAGFHEFAPSFQDRYPRAVETWKAAVQANDGARAQDAEATILSLAAALSAIAAHALTTPGVR